MLSHADSVSEKWEITEDFQGLRTEVEAGSAELQKMERDLRQQLLLNLEKILCDPSALEDLEALVSGVAAGRGTRSSPTSQGSPPPLL